LLETHLHPQSAIANRALPILHLPPMHPASRPKDATRFSDAVMTSLGDKAAKEFVS
jgi:hypothetical protein